MVIFRVIGWLLLLAGTAAFGRDLYVLFTTGENAPLIAGELWARIDLPSLSLMQAVVQRYILPELWDPVIVTILLAPVWLVFGLPGGILSWAFRRRYQPEPDN